MKVTVTIKYTDGDETVEQFKTVKDANYYVAGLFSTLCAGNEYVDEVKIKFEY